MFRMSRWLPWATRGSSPPAVDPPLDVIAVYGKYAALVHRSLQQLGVRTSELDDLQQEVFLIVHQRLHAFDASRSMPAWLFVGFRVEVNVAMRAPRLEGAEEVQAGDEHQGIQDDDPVLRSILTAPLDDKPMTEDERQALEEWRANPVGIPHEAVVAELAERAALPR